MKHNSRPLLTSDNPSLSEPKTKPPVVDLHSQIGCSDPVRSYLRKSVSENTRRAYRADITHFISWGGTLPASDKMVAEYLAAYAPSLSVATLTRRLSSLSKAHTAKGVPSPTNAELVKSTMRGIKRVHAAPQRVAQPLLVSDLLRIIPMVSDDVKGARDRALLLLGFAGGFRRSELVGLTIEDIEWVRQGMLVHLRRSKTDQEGQGRKIGIPYARGRWCPVESLKTWLEIANIERGPIFRLVTRHGHVGTKQLSAEAVNGVIKQYVQAIGFDAAEYSGHSLRAGLATSAAQAGVATWKIRQQTGHASDAMLQRYIRDGELFNDNAVGVLL